MGTFIIAIWWRGDVDDTPYLIVESIALAACKPNTDIEPDSPGLRLPYLVGPLWADGASGAKVVHMFAHPLSFSWFIVVVH